MAVDITNLAVVFGDTGGGQLTRKAWEDLQATRWAIKKLCDLTQTCLPIVFRDLINEISEWAYNGLVSIVFRELNHVVPDFHSKCQKLWNTLTTEVEMEKIKGKVNDTRSKFIVRFRCLDTII